MLTRPLPDDDLAKDMSEEDFMQIVIDYAMLRGWRVTHVRPGKTDHGWRVAYQGHNGLPDLVLAKNGRVLLAELKSNSGKDPTEDQYAWIAAAGMNGRVWRPKAWRMVRADLDGKRVE